MNIDIKDKAARFRRIANDDVFNEILSGAESEQVAVFLSDSATMEEVEKARDIVNGIKGIRRFIQSALDAERVHDRKLK